MCVYIYYVAFPGSSSCKEPDMPTNTGNIRDMVHFLGWEDPMEKSMANLSNILAWRIPWTEGSVGLQSMGCKELDTTEATSQAHICIYRLFFIHLSTDTGYFHILAVMNNATTKIEIHITSSR